LNFILWGRRAIIELVTARAIVARDEWARLRTCGSRGRAATHSLRAYLGSDIDFDAGREDATTTGSALICISGHIAG
jgi:hypothetical protein